MADPNGFSVTWHRPNCLAGGDSCNAVHESIAAKLVDTDHARSVSRPSGLCVSQAIARHFRVYLTVYIFTLVVDSKTRVQQRHFLGRFSQLYFLIDNDA